MASFVVLNVVLAAMVAASPLQSHATQENVFSKRDDISTAVRCGNFGTANSGDSDKNWYNLHGKGGIASAAAKSCSRLGCYNTSGMYLCNDQDVDIEIDLKFAMENAGMVLQNVCAGGAQDAMSGQVFTDAAGGYNLISAYCNGNEADNKPPSEYTVPGPNGNPTHVCGFEDLGQPSCDVGQCLDDAIEVTSTELVDCNIYVSDAAVGAGHTQSQSVTRSISEGFSVGGSLGLNIGLLKSPLGAIGFDGSYTRTTTTGSVTGGSEQCGPEMSDGRPANWTCTIEVAPKCHRFMGTCGTEKNGRMPYDMTVPALNPATGNSIYNQDMCICKDCEGWAEMGAPQRACTIPCLSCASGPQPGS